MDVTTGVSLKRSVPTPCNYLRKRRRCARWLIVDVAAIACRYLVKAHIVDVSRSGLCLAIKDLRSVDKRAVVIKCNRSRDRLRGCDGGGDQKNLRVWDFSIRGRQTYRRGYW